MAAEEHLDRQRQHVDDRSGSRSTCSRRRQTPSRNGESSTGKRGERDRRTAGSRHTTPRSTCAATCNRSRSHGRAGARSWTQSSRRLQRSVLVGLSDHLAGLLSRTVDTAEDRATGQTGSRPRGGRPCRCPAARASRQGVPVLVGRAYRAQLVHSRVWQLHPARRRLPSTTSATGSAGVRTPQEGGA